MVRVLVIPLKIAWWLTSRSAIVTFWVAAFVVCYIVPLALAIALALLMVRAIG
jgi:hypothetical protein